jgi:predicted AlkP superfamily phosphohydrolase/phosphomutase
MVAAGLTGCGEPPVPAAQSAVIGLDGADWRNALPLIRQGKLPVLAALQRAGTSGIQLTNADYRWSPVLWTSIATGKLPERHGVTSFMAQVEGFPRPIPTPSTERKCRAIWNLFSEQDRTVGFVGWWVTWPAEPVNGFIVTDHFSISRFDLGSDYERDPSGDYEVGRTYPEELFEEIRDLKVDRQEIGRADFARFADLPDAYEFPTRFAKFDKPSEFAIAHSVDRTHFAAGRKLLVERDPDLFGIFLQGIDIMQHYYWEFMDPDGAGTEPPEDLRAIYGQAVERYYGYADGLVGDLVEAGGDDRAYLLVSDHGFRPSQERYEEKGISGEHRRQAFFLVAGPGVQRGARYGDFDAVDATPTLLAYHGLPVAEDFDGEAVRELFTPEWQAERPARTVPTYETGPWERGVLPGQSELEHLKERISALGYIDE